MSARIGPENTAAIKKALALPFAPQEDEDHDPQRLDLWGISGRLTTHAGKPRIDITDRSQIMTYDDYSAAMSEAQDAADNIPRR